MDIKGWWEIQDAGRKRNIAIFGGLGALVVLLTVIPGKEPTQGPEAPSEVEVEILSDDMGQGDMAQFAAQIKVGEGERANIQLTLQRQEAKITQLTNALAAATSIADNPEQLGALVDEINRLKEDLEEMRESGVSGAGGQEKAPVQLVLGGDGSETPSAAGAASDPLTSPLTDFSDDEMESLTSYDPLARIKGAIDPEKTSPAKNDRGGRFNFMNDSTLERPAPQIVIEGNEETTQVAPRSGGSRPGQSSRDLRGEMLEDFETPVVYLPSGTLFEGVLLNGMDAPTSSTAAREPYPASIRLTSLAFLPNRFKTNVKGCFVGAAGFGRLDSERVHLRTETLSCVLRDGGVIDVKLEGYISGEDGKVGLRGTVVERTGQLLMRAALSGVGSGFSMALEPRQVQSVRTGNEAGGVEFDAPDFAEVAEIGAYKGASTAMEKLADYYLERAEQIFPIIEVDAMRKVTVHMTSGVALKPLENEVYGTLARNESRR